jgi:hypothetical protein
MLILLGLLLDGAVTLTLGVVIAMESRESPFFYVSLVALHGLVAGLGIIVLMGTGLLEKDASATPETIPTDRARRGPEVVPAFVQPRLKKAA